MSTYKGYVPWKTSASSYSSSKSSPAGSRYSSRDEISNTPSDSKLNTRFGSITSPSSYRPSYSGGTYRSSGIKRDPVPLSLNYSSSSLSAKPKIKEPSLSTNNRPIISVSRVRSRDPSPSLSTKSYSRSRDPSPSEPVKDRFVSASNYVSPYSKLYTRSSGYGNKLSVGNGNSHTLGSTSAISYMTANDTTDRCRKLRVEKEQKSAKTSEERSQSREKTVANTKNERQTSTESDGDMIEITVVTRATSPTLCPTTNYSSRRRIEVAKTISKTIKRSTRKVQCEDKEVQSDRMDDTSKYCRFNTARATAPWLSYIDSKYTPNSYNRYTNSNSPSPSRYSGNKNDKNESDSSEKSPEKSTSNSRENIATRSLTRSSSIKSNSKSDKSKSKSPPIHPSQKLTSPTKSKNFNSKALPPVAPKAESPSKVTNSSSASSCTSNNKFTNKDFRKSVLNVGPTDRTRKIRSSSVDPDGGTDNKRDIDRTGRKSSSPLQNVERSSSVSSEVSYSSNNTLNSNSDDMTKNFVKLKISQTTTPIAQPMMHTENTTATFNSNDHAKQNESYAKNDETKSSIFLRALSPTTTNKLFKTNIDYTSVDVQQHHSDNEVATATVSLHEGFKQDTTESMLNQMTTNGTTLLNKKMISNDTNNWFNSNRIDDQTIDPNSNTNMIYSDCVNMKNKLRHIDSGELPWWLNETENEYVDSIASLNQSENQTESLKTAEGKDWLSDDNNTEPVDTSEGTKSIYRISHIRSGERAWWLEDNDANNSNKSVSNMDETDNSANFTFKIKRIESGEKAWWLTEDNETTDDNTTSDFRFNLNESVQRNPSSYYSERQPDRIYNNDKLMPLGDRASPEGLEDLNNTGRLSPYDNFVKTSDKTLKKTFISRHENIDDLLGGSCHTLNPMRLDCFAENNTFEKILPTQVRVHDGTAQKPYVEHIADERESWDFPRMPASRKLDDATIQVYKDGDYGAYLDLESSLAEQTEEIEGLHTNNRKNSLVVRTQLSVRVHAIIEKLLTSEGRELRRALFSLKQIFQDDKDLVHGFVALGGLNSLVRVGSDADQNYQNYILRALGQVMLYVDGMNGVMRHGPTIQWLYSLIASKYRLVVKTALKLLLVFVEYVESNCYLLVNAIHAVDSAPELPWSNIMKLLKDYENADTELLIYATSLINKTLSGLSDQDCFYDESDYLEQQGMEGVIQRYMSRPGTDLDLLDQLQLYEAVLKFEDGETADIRIPDNSIIRKTLRCRSINTNGTDQAERRKSRRHSTGNTPLSTVLVQSMPKYHNQTLDEDSSSSTNSGEMNEVFGITKGGPHENAGVTPGLRRRRERAERQKSFMREQQEAAAAGIRPFDTKDDITNHGLLVTAVPCRLQNDSPPTSIIGNDVYDVHKKHAIIPAVQKLSTIMPDIDESNYVNLRSITTKCNGNIRKGILSSDTIIVESDNTNELDEDKLHNLNNLHAKINSTNGYCNPKSIIMSVVNQKNLNNSNMNNVVNGNLCVVKNSTTNGIDYNQNGLPSPNIVTKTPAICTASSQPTKLNGNFNENSTQSYVIQNGNNLLKNDVNNTEESLKIKSDITKDSENDEKKLLVQLKRDHTVKDLTQKLSNLPMSPQEEKMQNLIGDMTGLISKAKEGLAKSKSKGDISRSPSKDQEIKKPEPKKSENELHWEELVKNMTRPLTLCDLDFTDLHSEDDKDDMVPRGAIGSIPPPPPLLGIRIAPPMPRPMPPPTNLVPPPNFRQSNDSKPMENGNGIKKNKKTVKLFWKEVREDLIPVSIGKTIWDELPKAIIDTQKLEHLFESRAKDLMAKKQQEQNKNKEIIVLDHKRSNAINIAMTKLPPPRAIKAAILKMDATVVTREGIDKLMNMLPTDEERGKIQEAQMISPELPLGSAEQFLLTLSSISELAARLKLWAFKLDFENSEKEIAEPLMDLKQGLDVLRNNKTFKCILSTLLSIGIFLNGAPVKGFQIEYLAKVPEVKDTVQKHSLLHHLCHIVMESSTDTTDLYSEIGPVTRASKTDFADLAHNITYLEAECKASWDRLKLIAKHDCPPQLKQKLVDFLADCAERIIILETVHRRVINRYRKFLFWLGVPQHRIIESRPNEVCRIISEFALEYRTTRERVHQQLEKKANHRERNKTRGKMIIDVAKFRSTEDRADAELKQLLGTHVHSPSVDKIDSTGNCTWRRRRPETLRSPALKMSEDGFTDGDDEILESLVKTATKASTPRTTPRERKRTRNADRKSLRRTLKNGLTDEEKQHVATFIKSY